MTLGVADGPLYTTWTLTSSGLVLKSQGRGRYPTEAPCEASTLLV